MGMNEIEIKNIDGSSMTASKDSNWVEDLIERCKNDPSDVERRLMGQSVRDLNVIPL